MGLRLGANRTGLASAAKPRQHDVCCNQLVDAVLAAAPGGWMRPSGGVDRYRDTDVRTG